MRSMVVAERLACLAKEADWAMALTVGEKALVFVAEGQRLALLRPVEVAALADAARAAALMARACLGAGYPVAPALAMDMLLAHLLVLVAAVS